MDGRSETMNIDRFERLMNLLAALTESPRPLTASEIRESVQGYEATSKATFRRAFERDKATLRDMGMPLDLVVRADVGPGEEAYRVRKDRLFLPDPGLDDDERAALHLAVAAVRLDGAEGAAALWKVGVPEDATKARAGDIELPASPAVATLFRATSERRSVRFSYRGQIRNVDPYRLDVARGRWYLTAFDHDRQDERLFRLDRIEGTVEAGEPGAFDRPATSVPGARLEPWQMGEGDPVAGTVLIDADQAPLAVATVGPDRVVEDRPDGSVVLELEVRNVDGFRSFVVGFLEHAEVLGPKELRASFIEWLEGVAEIGTPS